MKAAIQLVFLTLLEITIAQAQQYTISTFAGGAPPLTPIAGVQASIGYPQGVATDGAGNIYFASLNCLFKLDANGVMTLVAGNSRAGYSGDGGPATSAQLNAQGQVGVAVDTSGNVYIGDSGNSRVRKVFTSGIITTVAGTGLYGYSGDGGSATTAQLSAPAGLAVDASGNLYIADSLNSRIRKVSSTGVITTVAGNGSFGYSGDGGPATRAQLNEPNGVAVDSLGNLYIADSQNNRIRKVSAVGIITTIGGNGTSGYSGDGGLATNAQLNFPFSVAVDSSGNVYFTDNDLIGVGNIYLRKISPTGLVSTVIDSGVAGDTSNAIGLSGARGVATDAAGNVYIADSSDARILKMSEAGAIVKLAGDGSYSYSGDGGPATGAQLSGPTDVAIDSSGDVYIADADNSRIRKVSPAGVIMTVTGDGTTRYSGDGGPATNAELSIPYGVTVDASGNLYIADYGNSRIRKVSTAGIITTVAGNGSNGYSGDSGSATIAELSGPTGVAVDANGNLYVADRSNNRIRKVSTLGIITTVAGNGSDGYSGDGSAAINAELSVPFGVTVDASGNLYIADSGNNRIRKVSASGTISTIAGKGSPGYSGDGGQATNAELNFPWHVTVDATGNLYVSDQRNARIRKVSVAGVISTIAGSGSLGYSGDNGPATSAQFNEPEGVAVDAHGDIYVADLGNNAIRLLTPSSATGCSYSLSITSLQAPADGGNLNLTIATTAGCAWTIANLPDWINVSGSASGSGASTITLVVAANSGAPRSAQISVASITVTVNQASNLLLISTGGVVNDASYTAPVAPGSIAAIFGNFLLAAPVSLSSFPLPTSLDALSFQFTGAPLAPLFYANFGQVNAQVPWELAGQSQTTITATNGSQTSTPQPVNLATYAPGIFTLNGGGTGQGAILGANDHLADSTNAAIAGSTIVQIFCTGLGPVTNQPQTGAAAPTDPLAQTTTKPSVMIGGVQAQVQFSGLAPGYVGLYQVNALVPQAAAKGNAEPIVISIAGAQSNTVTIAVQ